MCKGYFRSLQVIVSRRSTTHFLITVCHAQRKGKCHCRITSPLKAQNNLLVGLSKVTSKLAVRMLSGSHISIFVLNHDVKKNLKKFLRWSWSRFLKIIPGCGHLWRHLRRGTGGSRGLFPFHTSKM